MSSLRENWVCSIITCGNKYEKTKGTFHCGYPITYHSFPKHENLQKQWLKSCNKTGVWKSTDSFVCSDHFVPHDFIYERNQDSTLPNKKRTLKNLAIPSQKLIVDMTTSDSDTEGSDVIEVLTSDTEVSEPATENDAKLIKINQQLVSMNNKFDILLNQYKNYQNASTVEIKKMEKELREKDVRSSSKLKEILAQHLTPTETELVMYLRKQKS